MNKPRRSVDGLRPRQSAQLPDEVVINEERVPVENDTQVPDGVAIEAIRTAGPLSATPPLSPEIPRRRRAARARGPLTRRQRIIKWVVIGLAVVLLGFGGWALYRVLSTAGSIFKGNSLGLLLPGAPLKTDTYDNTNVLLLGTSESDPGHPGAQLTDSMMILSTNQKTHQAFLLSIPRDLWVTYQQSCSVGDSGKINAVYECSLAAANNDETTAEKQTASVVSQVTGADIQYVAHLNLAVIQQVVDALGGVDITIESPDPRGILDRNFDWRCHYTCYLVKYANGPAHLDGTHAMWLAQARNDSGGYGLPRSNFDREANQRKILTAVKDKATSVGFLANPVNVINLLDALGNNIHTTIDSSEVKTFIGVAKDTPTNNITSIDIVSNSQGVLTTAIGPDGSQIVRPVAGLEDYKDLQDFVQKLLQGRAPVISENAPIDVLNASGVGGVAKQLADELSSAGMTTGQVTTIASGAYPHYMIYDLSKGSKPKTLAALTAKLKGATVATTLPKGVYSTAQFVVIVGADPNAKP
jgi:polyisoprenyl-teichoic acid--peptidoglycan teichoic acid transferase